MKFILPTILLCGAALGAALPDQELDLLSPPVVDRVVGQAKTTTGTAKKTAPTAKAKAPVAKAPTAKAKAPVAKATASTAKAKAPVAKATAKAPAKPPVAKATIARPPPAKSTAAASPKAPKKALPPTVHFHDDYHLKKVDAKGTSDVTFHQDGNVDFKVHFHESGALGYDYAVTCALRDSGGQTYTLTHKGKVHGTFSPGSRNSEYHERKKHAAVQQRWAQITAKSSWHCRTKMDWDVGSLVDEVVKVVKVAGPIVGSIIALF
jgi:hypothetical protein